jgi:hypothetical protein
MRGLRPLLVFIVVGVGAAAAAVSVARPAPAHRDPCHLAHTCPSDHHTYPWRGLWCTSYADERLPEDTRTVVVDGRTYWCHGSQTSTGGAQPAMSAGVACGVERWAVKTLTDAGARSIRLVPRATTIAALRRLRPPAVLGARRIGPVEKTVYRVRARLVVFKVEDDSDIHLVLADPHSGGTMIAEFPASFCIGAAAPAVDKAKMKAARAAILRCGAAPRDSFAPLAGLVTITGVGFWDFEHGQRGVAPNAIELHPVLTISGACT